MARKQPVKSKKVKASPGAAIETLDAIPAHYDQALALLFASSLCPVKVSDKSNTGRTRASRQPGADEINDALQEADSTGSVEETPKSSSSVVFVTSTSSRLEGKQNRKRKRNVDEDDVEGKYMDRLVQEEAREKAVKRHKNQASAVKAGTLPPEGTSDSESVRSDRDHERGDPDVDTPQHESLASIKTTKEDTDLEKASRTVFLANVSTSAIKSKAAKKSLLDHLASFLSSLAEWGTPHKVVSLRFRSTPFSTTEVPKKAAYAKKELMDSTAKSTNAYAVYSTQSAAREATKQLNGTVVLDRHLRVDSVAHPAKQDHRRCVFVGNLGFVDDMSAINAASDEESNKRPRKAKEPADVEEGLWRQFSKAGTVESVRVVRDKTTRVGKGFAYVQFLDANAVENALSYNAMKFPPMLPRILRVTRAKNIRKTTSSKDGGKRYHRGARATKAAGDYTPKVSSKAQSLSGRAGKLLGHAGAAQFRGAGDTTGVSKNQAGGIMKSGESIFFEGYRASSKQGKGTMKMGGSGNKQGKPRSRSSRRGSEFKRLGGKKGKS